MAEFRSTGTIRSSKLSPVYKAGKLTYVTPDGYGHDDLIACDPIATRIVRDDEIHFGGNWMETLVGIDLDFYGAESQAFKIDGVVFEVLEDPDDGYRSHMAGVLARSDRDYNFYDKPFARIQIEKISNDVGSQDAVEKMHGYQLVDVEDGHVWLTFGTEWYDDYYPMFRFEYKPKGSHEVGD